ncbi:MAG TPA: hypothetical protein VEJ16_04175 [Alphaproteobacteria bacterium]|nr:hypothetical protein [Alphaproteobacteria bacterium]
MADGTRGRESVSVISTFLIFATEIDELCVGDLIEAVASESENDVATVLLGQGEGYVDNIPGHRGWAGTCVSNATRGSLDRG